VPAIPLFYSSSIYASVWKAYTYDVFLDSANICHGFVML
jgi:hypothetical protein